MSHPLIQNPSELKSRNFSYYAPLAMLFVMFLMMANLTAQKLVAVGTGMLTGGNFIYPATYVISALLTEVYCYAMSRKVIWLGLGCNVLMIVAIKLVILLPSAAGWAEADQAAFVAVLDRTPQIVLASLVAFFVGEFTNTCILAKSKVFTTGKYLGLRAVFSTIIGQAIDSVLFTLIAFWGVLHWHELGVLTATMYIFKLIVELAALPIIYMVASFLKRKEGVDIFDRRTRFNPFWLTGLREVDQPLTTQATLFDENSREF